MKRVLLAVVLLSLLVPRVSAQDKDEDSVRIVTTGQILKIDVKKKTFQFRITLDEFPRGGRGGPRGGRGGPRYPFPPRAPEPGDVQYIPTVEVKVFTSDKTIFKARDTTIDLSKLRIGDRISITGIHKGKGTDIDALEINR